MKYNFDEIINRRNTDSLKWDEDKSALPMWVADMDFKVNDKIINTLINRINNKTYGYTNVSEQWFNAYYNFYKDRHNLILEKDKLVFSLGVVPTISSSVRALTEINDNVILTPPVYNIFYNSIINNKRNVLEVPLIYKNNQYYMDFKGLEEAFKLENSKLMILCNPANPISKIWSKEELDKLGRLAYKYNVIILSDEIHNELTRPNTKYVPFINANDVNKNISLTAISPTKTFNLAGLHTSAFFSFNETILNKVTRQLNTDECAEPNYFSCYAAISAYNDCRDWVDELREYIFNNKDYAIKYIKENIKDIIPIEGDATYLLWVDCNKIKNNLNLAKFLKDNNHLYISDGKSYGKGGEGFIRINLATPRINVIEGLKRLKTGIEEFKDRNK